MPPRLMLKLRAPENCKTQVSSNHTQVHMPKYWNRVKRESLLLDSHWTYDWNTSAACLSNETHSIFAFSCLSIRVCLAITSLIVTCSPNRRAVGFDVAWKYRCHHNLLSEHVTGTTPSNAVLFTAVSTCLSMLYSMNTISPWAKDSALRVEESLRKSEKAWMKKRTHGSSAQRCPVHPY